MILFSELDDTAQRTLVLRVAKACGPKTLADMCEDPPTLTELDERIQESISDNIYFAFWNIWMLPSWLEEAGTLLRMWRLRRAIRDHGQQFLIGEDLECDHHVLVGDIRRLLSNPPRSFRGKLHGIRKGLEQASRRWCGLHGQVIELEATLRGEIDVQTLTQMRDQVRNAIAQTADAEETSRLAERFHMAQELLVAQGATQLLLNELTERRNHCTEELCLMRTQLTLLFTRESAALPATSPASELEAISQRLTSVPAPSEDQQHVRM
jgi:hypothetical protein